MKEKEYVSFEKNKFERVVVLYKEYKGHALMDLRVFAKAKYDKEDKTYRRTFKGLSMSVFKMDELITALMEARQKMIEDGKLVIKEDEQTNNESDN